MKQLYFIRHGQTEWNAIRRMQGQWNSDLNDLGRSQAEVNGQLLAQLNIELLFASPLDRTRQTADIINSHLNLPVQYDSRLMEWDCGDWSGHLYDEIKSKWPEEWQEYQADRFNYRGPNCENYPDMFDRSAPFLKEISELPESRVAIVSHGMIGKAMMAQLLNLSEDETLAFHQPNDVIFHVTVSGDHIEACHYIGGEGPFTGYDLID